MGETTVQELMDSLPEFFVSEKSGGISAVVQFEISGDQGGEWTVRIEDSTCKVAQGRAVSADLVFKASAKDVIDIFYDRLDTMKAYMQGRLRLEGNIHLAQRLLNLFRIDAEKLNLLKKK